VPGDLHYYASSLFDGHWDHWRTCATCWRIGRDLCEGCWMPGRLWEDLWDTNGLRPNDAPSDDDGWWGDDDEDK
jgi:hypothetical protein